MKSIRSILLTMTILILVRSPMAVSADNDLVGTTPPVLNLAQWLNSEPLTLEKLKGRVVLIRWWTAPDCPFCKASSAALNEWHMKYMNDGLEVIGIYHHKSSSPLSLEKVRTYSQKFGFEFPVAIDDEWHALKEWWLFEEQRWTSVSFLLDREGIIRYIHPGGDYIKGDDDYQELERQIKQYLSD